ncbi:cryptochrome/photolyase family protein [Micromonospora sonneratiae]
MLLVESKAVFRRRVFHRQRAHLILSALRHRAAELGEQAIYLRTENYREALRRLDEPVDVCHPTTRRARDLVKSLDGVTMLPARGFVTSHTDFADWADERRSTLRIEDFYRQAQRWHGVLTDGVEPTGGHWNMEAHRRQPPPRNGTWLDVPAPPMPEEDEIDAEVRRDLDRWAAEGIRFVGRDGPRLFPATRTEAVVRLRHFVRHRLPMFGPYADTMRSSDPFMAHSMLSSSFNLGLLDPMEAIREAERAYRDGTAPLSSVEGFIRQLLGWRDFVWHLYWYFDAGRRPAINRPTSRRSMPVWFTELDADAVRAHCLSDVLAGVRDRAWVHHTPRLTVLANYALQRGWRAADLVDWFHRCFIDGTEWAMTVNLAGTNQYADHGQMVGKPYAVNGAHIKRMSDYCADCHYNPHQRLGGEACPYTTGYWVFLDHERTRGRSPGRGRMNRSLQRLDGLADVPAMVALEKERGSSAP